MRHRTYSTAIWLAALLIGVAAAVPGSVPAAAASTEPDVVGFVSTDDPAAVLAYWTPDRMAAAVPDDPGETATPPAGPAPVPGTAMRYPGQAPPASRTSIGVSPMALPQAVARPYTTPPAIMNGKVFFTKVLADGTVIGNFSCSGTSVNSPGLSLVWTAGHCVHGGPLFGVHRNWVFVPALGSSFDGNGKPTAPFGMWTANQLWTMTAWVTQADSAVDFGAAIVNRVGGKRLTETIGGQGIWVGGQPQQNFSAFGYPGAPYSGNDQFKCFSPVTEYAQIGAGPSMLGFHCAVVPGVSGGGWLISVNAQGLGYVNSVYSMWDTNTDQWWGPYMGDAALALWNKVKNLTV